MNFFDYHSDPQQEIIDCLYRGAALRIERIVSDGQSSEVYDQDEDEWAMVLEGEARLWIEGQAELRLKKGDHVFLAAHQRHQVLETSRPCLWLCVFVPAKGSND